MIAEAISGEGDVRVDESALTFIDLSGMRELANAAWTLGQRRRLVVHGSPPLMRMVAHLSGLAGYGDLEFEEFAGAA